MRVLVVGLLAIVLVLVLLWLLASGVRVVQEYERGVLFVFGRCRGARGPGIFVVPPFISRIVRVNLQTQAVPVASQQVITKDNVTVAVDAVAYFRVKDPVASVLKIQNWFNAAQLVAQTSLRSIIGRHELDQLLGERDRINSELKVALDEQTEAWGVEVDLVEIRDVGLPEQMQRAMARQAEAERERRAKIIAADGEMQASEKLGEAATMMAASPGRCSCARCRRWPRSRPSGTRRSSSRSPSSSSTCSARSPESRRRRDPPWSRRPRGGLSPRTRVRCHWERASVYIRNIGPRSFREHH